jgi:hypothetical protein
MCSKTMSKCLLKMGSKVLKLIFGVQIEVKWHSNRSKNKLMIHVISAFCIFKSMHIMQFVVSGDS